jgi:hypothetical protein
MYGLSREVSATEQSAVTTNAEKSAEAEVADFEQAMAKGRIICDVNRECMSIAQDRRGGGSETYIRVEVATGVRSECSGAEIKKDGR